MDLNVQLWAFRPGSNDHVILPQPISWQASMVLSDVGSMQIVYPLDAPNIDALDFMSGGTFVGSDVELRYWNGSAWVCPPNGRFEVTDIETDAVAETENPTRTFTLQSWSARPLWSVRQSKVTGLDADGTRPFVGVTVGQIVGTLITEAQNRGDVPDLTYSNLITPGLTTALQVPPGQNLQELLPVFRDEARAEWLVLPDSSGQGRKLTLMDSVGTDKSGSVDLREGRDLVAAPSHISTRDIAAAALVQGDNNSYVVSVNNSFTGPYGNNMDFVTASGVTDPLGLDLIGSARLVKGEQPRAEHTRDLRFETAKFLPLVNYGLGDTILAANARGEMEGMRVQQITLTFDQDGLAGNLVLGDRFSERVVRLERVARGITGGAANLGGAGSLPGNVTAIVDDALDDFDVGANVQYLPYAPTTEPGNEGYTWFQTSGNTTVAIWKYTGGSWVKNPVGQAALNVGYLSALSADLGNVNAGSISGVYISGTTISGGTITGSVINTASSGNRVELGNNAGGRPAGDIWFYKSTGAYAGGIISSAGGSGIIIGGSSGNGVEIYTPNATTTVDAKNVGINGSSAVSMYSGGGGDFTVSGSLVSSNTIAAGTATGIPNLRITASNNIMYTSHANSSIRYKVNVDDADDMGAAFLKLRPVTYWLKSQCELLAKWMDDPETDWDSLDYEPLRRNVGFIAEEVQAEGLDDFIYFDSENRPDELDYARMVVAIQQLCVQFDKRLTTLEAQND